MKGIALSLASAALLSVTIAPMAQAATHLNQTGGLHPTILNPARTTPTDVEPSAQVRPIASIEQARLNRLDRTGNTNGSLNSYQQTAPNDLDPHNIAAVSPLQQMRLNHLNNSN